MENHGNLSLEIKIIRTAIVLSCKYFISTLIKRSFCQKTALQPKYIGEEPMDKIDRAILTALQRDGRISNVHLAEQVGLSESACLRRVRLLEQTGVIDRYVTLINQAATGKPNNIFVRVTLDGQQREKLAHFEKAVRQVPEVMDCYLISGDFDYLLRVIARDNADYVRLHNELTGLSGVLRVQSSFALRSVINKTELPLEPGPEMVQGISMR